MAREKIRAEKLELEKIKESYVLNVYHHKNDKTPLVICDVQYLADEALKRRLNSDM